MSWESGGWAPYVTVAERHENARRHIAKRRKQGLVAQPIHIQGLKIARTFWGKSWCNHLESFSDYANRLPRGRTYARNGSVCHLEMLPGEIKAIVSGSEIYDVKITIKKLPQNKWSAVKEQCSGQVGSLLELLQGKLSNSVMKVVTNQQEGLFPVPGEIKLNCSCPDSARMCKHVAAALYGVGARLDDQPQLLFTLRGVDHEELIEADTTALVANGKQKSSRRIADSDLADVFGIEMVQREDDRPIRRGIHSKESKPLIAARGAAETKAGKEPTKVRKPKQEIEAKRLPSDEQIFTCKTISDLRIKFDMSKSELALLIGVSSASIGKWEKERGHLNLQPRTRNSLHRATLLTKRQAWKQVGI